MKKWFVRILCLSAIWIAPCVVAQQSYIEYISDYAYFDRDLIPGNDIYGDSWDSANVDSPRFDRERVSWGMVLDLAQDDCAYVHPCQNVITSNFGWRRGRMHKGIDIDLNIGDPVYAAFDGIVRLQRYNHRGFGNYVMIRHYNGLETLYAHLSEAVVIRNQSVRAGQIIGFGGSTGRSTGSHLHFETRLMGQAFDPKKIIDFANGRLIAEQVYLNDSWFSYLPKNMYTQSGTYVAAKPQYTKVYYTIRKGDTLYSIARRKGTSVKRLCQLNGIRSTTTLRIGRRLRVK